MKTSQSIIGLLLLLLSTVLFGKSEAILKLDTQGHTSLVKDLIVTKNGNIITASDDKTIRVWDKSGKQKRKILGELQSNSGEILAIALSNDEKYLAVGGALSTDEVIGSSIRLYNYETGKLLKLLKSHTNSVLDLAFSKDDKYLISGSGDKTVKIWNVQSDFTLKDTLTFHTNYVYAVQIIKKQNDYYSASAGHDNKIILYNIDKSKIIKTVNSKYNLNSLATTPSTDFGNIAVCGESNEIVIFNYELEQIKQISLSTNPWGLSYSSNGKYLLSGTSSLPHKVNIYNVKDDYSKKIEFLKHNNLVMSVGFLDNKTAISIGGNNKEIYIWDINSAKVVKKIQGVGAVVWSVGIKENKISWGNIDPCPTCPSLGNKKGVLEKSINLSDFKITKDTADFKRISTLNGKYSLIHAKGGDYGLDDAVLKIKKNGITRKQIIKNAQTGLRHNTYGWYKNYIISGGTHGRLKVYNKLGLEVASLVGHSGEIWALGVYKDRLVSGSDDQTILLWDLSSLDTMKREFVTHEWFDKSWKDWIKQSFKDLDITKQKDIEKLYKRLVRAKDPDASMLLIPPKIYPILNIFTTEDDNYVVWSTEGFFDASKDAGKYIGYHINQGDEKEAEYVTVDSLYNTFYRPDLIQQRLNGKDLRKYSKNINIDKLLNDGLAPEVQILTKTLKTNTSDLDLKMQVCQKGQGGFDNLSLLINGISVSVVGTSRALKLKKKSKRKDCFIYNQTISLAQGTNNIGFKATNKAGNIESKIDTVEIFYDNLGLKHNIQMELKDTLVDDTTNNLHILAIGVNEYKEDSLKLKYSINDAAEILKTIQTVSKPLFKNVYTYKLFDDKVTKKTITEVFENINSTREDVFLLYIAGHGITDEYNGNYYYIPYNFLLNNNINAVQEQGIGQKDLMLGLSKITALKSLVLLDTCNSGSFVEANIQKTTTNRLSRATGRATLSASSSTQVAYEGYKGHGVFTYTLIEALKGKGYKNNNKITINELSSYVKDILPNRTSKKWGYKQLPQSSMYGIDFNIGKKE